MKIGKWMGMSMASPILRIAVKIFSDYGIEAIKDIEVKQVHQYGEKGTTQRDQS